MDRRARDQSVANREGCKLKLSGVNHFIAADVGLSNTVAPITISLITFACVFGGALLGLVLRAIAPERHLPDEAKDVIKLGLGLITTMNALVLGLLISTAKSSYDARRLQVEQMATDSIFADRSLALYGSETKDARAVLRDFVVSAVQQIEAAQKNPSNNQLSELKSGATDFFQRVRELSPQNEEQRALKTEVLRISLEVAQIRAAAFATRGSTIPVSFLVALIFWLAILFTGFGFFAPRNLTVLTALLICAFTVSAAVFMIVEMDEPLTGFMRLSSEPLINAISVMGK
jgi:Protein of unknown function (DUF4239)